jgi:hypothetical protein
LKTVLFDHHLSEQPSLQHHSLGLAQEHGCNISKQGLDKRFNDKAVNFLSTVFKNYLSKRINTGAIKSEWEKKFSAIRIMDSTEFKLPASLCESFPGYNGSGTKSGAQIQFEYDMFSGNVENISLEKILVSDVRYGLDHMDTLSRDSLVIRDLGYFNVDAYKKLEAHKVYYISRLKPLMNLYQLVNNQYKQLSYASIIKKLNKSGKPYLDLDIYIGRETLYPVRLVANLLSKDATTRREQKIKDRRSKFNKADIYLNKLNLFITNTKREMVSSDELYKLYKLRWQVEIIFKGWKSILKIHKVRKMNANRFRCYLLSKLIWILFCWDLYNTVNTCAWQGMKESLSIYKCIGLIKLRVISLREIFMNSQHKLYQWILSIKEILLDYGLKEHRNGRMKVSDLLKQTW